MLYRTLLLLGACASARAEASRACLDRPGAPVDLPAESSDHGCESFRGRCDSASLGPRWKAALLLHCPTTCAGTMYSDGSGTGYCPCQEGRDCCFDEPNDCAARLNASAVPVVTHVMCRKSAGLCTPEQQRPLQQPPSPQQHSEMQRQQQRLQSLPDYRRRSADASCAQGSEYPIFLKNLNQAFGTHEAALETAIAAAHTATAGQVIDPLEILQAARGL